VRDLLRAAVSKYVSTMSDKFAVVTGGTRGLGRALSLELAAAGYRVAAVYHSDDGAAASLQAIWAAQARGSTCVRADLRDRVALELPLDTTAEDFVFIHNAAAAFAPKPFHLTQLDEFTNQWDVAVVGFVRCMQPLLRAMTRAGRGTVATVGSRAQASLPPRGFSAYGSAKSALASLTASVASEYGARGIRTLHVCPRFMRTALTDAWDAGLREAVAASGESTPEDVASAIVRLVRSADVPGRGESYDV
jgi:3-oxoacyl-[acyl-carrier protein] reductase